MKPLPRIEGEVQRYQIGPDGDEWVKADDYAALNDYAALVQMERDSARAEAAENEGVIRVWRRRTETAEAEVERLKAALKTVGDDYPGSSCQQWCYEQAGIRLPDSAPEGPNDGL